MEAVLPGRSFLSRRRSLEQLLFRDSRRRAGISFRAGRAATRGLIDFRRFDRRGSQVRETVAAAAQEDHPDWPRARSAAWPPDRAALVRKALPERRREGQTGKSSIAAITSVVRGSSASSSSVTTMGGSTAMTSVASSPRCQKRLASRRKSPSCARRAAIHTWCAGSAFHKERHNARAVTPAIPGQQEAAEGTEEIPKEQTKRRQQREVDPTLAVHGVAHDVDLNQIPPETQKQGDEQNDDAR